MTSNSKICLSSRPSRKRETGQTVAEYAVAITVIAISVATLFAILSGGIETVIRRVVEAMPT